MRLDPIEKRVVRAVFLTLGIVLVLAAALAFWSRYRIYSEQKLVEQRREYEEEMAQLMDSELLARGMSRGIVRATLGAPDSVAGGGEVIESWHYANTRNYGAVALRFEHDRLVRIDLKNEGNER